MSATRILLFLLLLPIPSAVAFDSSCRNVEDEECSGLEAARLPWANEEHTRIWARSRALAGLPGDVDAAFTLRTHSAGHVGGLCHRDTQ